MKRPESPGQALAELALVLPIFLFVLFGTVDFGRGIFIYAQIANGAREGARYAIVHGSLAQTIDGSCGSGPGAASSDANGSLVIQATAASAPAWAPTPAGCSAPIAPPPIGLDLSQYKATVCWGADCTVPADCSAAGTNTAPSNAPDVPVTVRTCYRFQPILTSFLRVGAISLAAEATLYIAH